MPTVRINGVSLYDGAHGAGPAHVLIAGLNSDHALFRPFLLRLAECYRVIDFDNRGIGWSTVAASASTIESLAEDMAGLLQALEIRRAHVLGVFLGGRIAGSALIAFGSGQLFFLLQAQAFVCAVLAFLDARDQ